MPSQTIIPPPPPKYTGPNGNYTVPLIILTTLFFMWGFITVLNDVLIPHLKGIFELNYFQAMVIQLCFFGAYGVVSYPAGFLVKHIGYKKGVVIGLVIAGIGCLMFYPAGSFRVYAIFLAALFVLAAGITILQVAANPYVTRLGNPESAAQRLTLTQAFNSLGTTIGPIFGSILILSAACGADLSSLSSDQLNALRQQEAEAVQTPYLMIAGMLFVLAAVFALLKNLPVIVDAEAEPGHHGKSAWQYRHLTLGAIAIFVYVGAEVSIGSLIVNFLGEANIANMENCDAGEYVSYYWGAAMIGRFLGVALMAFVRPARFLVFNACAACVLLVLTALTSGPVAMWSVLAIGLFNATMFPIIFSLAVHRLGPATSQGSGILCFAIVGGAFIPPLQGFLADNVGLQLSFLMPIVCYLYIAFYGIKGYQVKS